MKEVVSIILPAGAIPNNTPVRKPNGTKEYVLHHKLPLYSKGDESKQVQVSADLLLRFLMATDGEGIEIVQGTTKLAVVFDDINDAVDFLEEVRDKVN